MEPNRYYVKNGDTLPSIAEELGLSISEIKKYHNESSRPHEWIKEDNSLPVWSTFIIIPDSVEVLKRKKEDFLSSERAALIQKETDTDDYLILQKIDMQVSGGSMIDSETEMMWEFRKFRKDGIFYGEIQQKSHQVKYIKSIYRQFAEYMQKFNKPLEHLVIELSHKGGVESLANQDEIMERWNRLKNELQPEMGNTLEEKNIIEGGDRDFSDTLPLIKNNILYTLFLNDLFYEYADLGTFVEQEKQQYTSQVFANEKVMLLSKRKVEKEGDILKIKFYSEADPGKNGHLKSIYNTKLKDFLQENFDYALTWSLEYHFDIRKGKMLLCHSKIKEQASRRYTHLTEHTIQLSKN